MDTLEQMHWYIGPNLRRERDIKGIRQIPFAQMAGMSQGNLSNIESNKQSVNWDQVQLFAKILEISADRLTNETNNLTIHIENQNGSANGNHNVVHNPASEHAIRILEERVHSQHEEILYLRKQLEVSQKQVDTLTGLMEVK